MKQEKKLKDETSPFDIPGEGMLYQLDDLTKLLEEMSKKFDIDEEEIYIGRSEIPPEIQSCLVYIEWEKSDSYLVFFRKNMKPNGRWICLNYMHHVRTDRKLKKERAYDYRNNIAYVTREKTAPGKIRIDGR